MTACELVMDGRRVHQEDFCQAFGIRPIRKYENEGGPGVERVARLLRDYLPPERAAAALERFRDALIVSWLISATDGHAKNYAVLLSGRQVALAPLYDIASLAPYPEFDFQRSKLAMRIGKRYRIMDITRTDWERSAQSLGLDPEVLVERILTLSARIPDELASLAKDPAVEALGSELPSRLLDAVAARISLLTPRLTRATQGTSLTEHVDPDRAIDVGHPYDAWTLSDLALRNIDGGDATEVAPPESR